MSCIFILYFDEFMYLGYGDSMKFMFNYVFEFFHGVDKREIVDVCQSHEHVLGKGSARSLVYVLCEAHKFESRSQGLKTRKKHPKEALQERYNACMSYHFICLKATLDMV